jgi:hypothetical protein
MNLHAQLRATLTGLASSLALLSATAANAQVTVTVLGNQALAQISLPMGQGTVDADVTITFDSPVNLTAAELNLTATLVDPNDTALLERIGCSVPPAGCPLSIDPAFPLLITVEPLNVPWVFHSGFEVSETDPGNLGFLNTYEFELHTSDLDCTAPGVGLTCPATAYRLFKAPVGGAFQDYTDDIVKGSVRARGRDGAFSEFLIVADARASQTVEPDKALALETRIAASALSETLRTDLLGKLAEVQVAALVDLDYPAAIGNLDMLIAEIQTNAGTNIENRWSSDHSVVNDAGEMEGLAQTLRYTLLRLQNGN